MRTAFARTLRDLASDHEDLYLLNGDLGYTVWEDFMEAFPDRCINVGVAEQNMIGIAAGMALCGKTVYVYSIIPFATMRCFEQIRNDVCSHNLQVRIVGVGSGFSYAEQGPTHHSIEDIALMRALPNMCVVAPADPYETRCVVLESVGYPGPMYIRLGKRGEPTVHKEGTQVSIGRAITVRDGYDATLISTGNILPVVLDAALLVAGDGISVRVISMHTVKPLDEEVVMKAAVETKAIFTVEEHSVIGGLGSAVAEVLAESRSSVRFKRVGIPDMFTHAVGTQESLRHSCGLGIKELRNEILKTLEVAR